MIAPKPAKHVVEWFLRTFKYGGITLPPFGIYILSERLSEDRLIKHENEHWRQAQEHGVFVWYLKYLWYNLKCGYFNNPFEVAAREAELK